jgi:hypothetical protein
MDVLSNGQVIRHGITGRMLFTGIGGQLIGFMDTHEEWQAECVALAEQIGTES